MLERIDVDISEEELEKQAHELALKVQSTQRSAEERNPALPQTSSPSPSLIISPLSYHLFALSEIHTWHLSSNKTPPSYTCMTRVLLSPRATRWTWEDVHLAAQVQGVLYSLRILGQILRYVCDSDEASMSPGYRLAYGISEAMPKLEELMLLNENTAGKDAMVRVEKAVDRLVKTLQPDENSTGEATIMGEERLEYNKASKAGKAAKKRRRGQKGREQVGTKSKAPGGSNNMYEILVEDDGIE